MKERGLIQRTESAEMMRPFPEFRRLFDYAQQQGIGELSSSIYFGSYEGEDLPEVPLPKEFLDLVKKYPGKYFIVSRDDRTDAYNRVGTRERLVRLSTVKKRTDSDEKVREIDLTEVDPSRGNLLEVKVVDSIKNKSFATIDQATGTDVAQPSGKASQIIEIDPQGRETIKEMAFSRLDEGLFLWKDKQRPVRWLRRLTIGKDSQGKTEAVYEDQYLIGRPFERDKEECTQIKIKISGSLDHPSSIQIQIGIGSPESAKVLYNSSEKGIKIIECDPTGVYKHQKEILAEDPNYARLLSGESVDSVEIITFIRSKIEALQKDWDKPQPVFSGSRPALGEGRRELDA